MFKKALFISLAASALMAGHFATLKDGRTIIMHENGTWAEVQTVKSPDAQVAAMAARDIAGSPKAIAISEPLARMLVGEWKSSDGSMSYNFRNDGTVTYTIDGDTKSEGYTLQFIDSSDNTLGVSIGDSSRYGKVVFGGNFRKFKIDKSGTKMIDYTEEITSLKTVELKKIGGATSQATSAQQSATPSKKIEEVSLKNGFVK